MTKQNVYLTGLGVILLSQLFLSYPVQAAEKGLKSTLNAQLRFDDRSGKDSRVQYRLRWYPQYTFSDSRWSLNTFFATGDDFSGSHNTISTSHSDHFYLRRAYLRYQANTIRTELGVIPTYKGKVSSSGLSKNGFIKGFRGVIEPNNKMELELVLGSLNDTRAKRALELPDKLDYFELELSTQLTDSSGYELSIERMTGANFLRTEYRFEPFAETELFVEWIKKVEDLDDKIVLGIDTEFVAYNIPFALEAYYSYVSAGMGARAELTEDFIATGHGVSMELDTPLLSSDIYKLFFRFDGYKGNTRFMFGVELKI